MGAVDRDAALFGTAAWLAAVAFERRDLVGVAS
jgi:hypothetical protein